MLRTLGKSNLGNDLARKLEAGAARLARAGSPVKSVAGPGSWTCGLIGKTGR
ncbi:hypothetical protein ABIE37_001159 [Arthrobacter bambusae]|uniref:Uncharacterized protein n=1 Tax=Arthrobacter bambusae TaxID=1338426 RepID=A0ABV2P3Y2_9MICC